MKPRQAAVLFVLLAAVVLRWAVGGVEWLNSYRLSVLFVVGVLALLLPQVYERDSGPTRSDGLTIGLSLALIVVLLAYDAGWEAAGPLRPLQLTLLFGLFAAYPLAHADVFDADRRDLAYLGAGIVVVGAFFHYAFEWPPGVLLAHYAVARATLFLSSLFVIPRYVDRDAFLWAVSALASIIVGLGLLAYPLGEYSLFSLHVNLYPGTYSLPLVAPRTPFLQSILVNPNDTGMWAFAGLCAAVFLAHQAYRARRWPEATVGATFAFLNVVGLYLTHGRASILGAAAALALYAAYVGSGREAVPYAAVAIGSAVLAFVAAIFFGILAIDDNARFAIWWAGLRALLDNPTLLGEKLDTSEVIAPYLEGHPSQGITLHNSYLALFVQTGILGGLAYLALTVGRVIDGLFLDAGADMALLSMAFGCAILLFFSSTILFWPVPVSVLISLVFGYAIFAPPSDRERQSGSSDEVGLAALGP